MEWNRAVKSFGYSVVLIVCGVGAANQGWPFLVLGFAIAAVVAWKESDT